MKGNSKFELLQKSKFTICGESISYPGFTTEKIIHSFNNCSIPIYCGDPLIEKVFNPKAFVHCTKDMSMEELTEKITEIDCNDRLYMEMLMQPITNDPDYCKNQHEKLKSFLYNIFDQEPETAYRRIRNYKGREYESYMEEYARINNTLWFRLGKKLNLFR